MDFHEGKKSHSIFQSKRWWVWVFIIGGALYVSFGWNWHYFEHTISSRIFFQTVLLWLTFVVGYIATCRLYFAVVRHFSFLAIWWKKNLPFWGDIFFIFGTTLGTVYFISNHLIRHSFIVVWTLFTLLLFYLFLRFHPTFKFSYRWLFLLCELVLSIFSYELITQYLLYRYSFIDPAFSSWRHAVYPRSIAMTSFWIGVFFLTYVLMRFLPKRIHTLLPYVWLLIFLAGIFLQGVNLGIAYYSGLYFSPTALDHVSGSWKIVMNQTTYLLFFMWCIFVVIFFLLFRRSNQEQFQKYRQGKRMRYVIFMLLSWGILVLVGAWRSTPEYMVAQSFYDRYISKIQKDYNIHPELLKKLERFGLHYNTENFFVARKERVFEQPRNLLPKKLKEAKPNIVLIFWESFSAQLSEVYNPQLTGVTPGAMRMAQDPNTTIFYNFYNASTPTVTGILAALCSFLPPIGHEEIRKQEDLRRINLSCLPEVLRNFGWKKSIYITAVEKDFSNKDTLLLGMGIDTVYGTSELKDFISGKPLSWGYSDHQMLPVVWDMMKKNINEPFFIILSTVDTHPPYTQTQDMVSYGDGTIPLLNAFHTTDDAFRIFWEKFIKSEFYQNTIVVVIGDHAVFPSIFVENVLKLDKAEKLNYYDKNFFTLYIPESLLPKEVKIYSSSLDFAPTLLHILDINVPNIFEGHSIFESRSQYPSLIGMHEFGLYTNEQLDDGKRKVSYFIPSGLSCNPLQAVVTQSPLTPCELWQFYQWKRSLFHQGRLFNKGN